jgi:hypothetical protein
MGRYIFRWAWRVGMAVKRKIDAIAVFFGGLPRKIDRFNRLVEPEILRAVETISTAEVIVGIPFYKEVNNLPIVVSKALIDLEARGEPAAIVIVGERKTHSLLFGTTLPASTNLVRIVRFAKPYGFGQKPGLSRRSWAHWAMLQVASRLQCDLIFIDADVRNTEGWVDLYLRAMRDSGADVAVATYIRSFGSDDAMVHIWDRLIFGALFGRWIEFRQGGDYAMSRRVVPTVLKDPFILREGAYTLDSAVMAHVTAVGGRIEFVWLGRKQHEDIEPRRLFERLPDLVRSVFDDIETHLPALLAMPHNGPPALTSQTNTKDNPAMQELIGGQLRLELYADLLQRFETSSDLLRITLGNARFQLCVQKAKSAGAASAELASRQWALATFRFLARYIWKSGDEKTKRALAKAYVPLMELGALGFLNRTADLGYQDAMNLLESEYLPEFRTAWRTLARRRIFHKTGFWWQWSVRSRLGAGIIRVGRRFP